MHPEKWYEWLIQTDECLAAHTSPGACVGHSGPLMIGIIILGICGYFYLRNYEYF